MVVQHVDVPSSFVTTIFKIILTQDHFCSVFFHSTNAFEFVLKNRMRRQGVPRHKLRLTLVVWMHLGVDLASDTVVDRDPTVRPSNQ